MRKIAQSARRGVLASLVNSGWIQNTTVAALGVVTAIICAIMKMTILKTSVITASVLLTALVWIVGLTIIRVYDRGTGDLPFNVALETGYTGVKRDTTQIFCQYNRNVSPVPLALFLRAVNQQEVPANISLLKVETLQEKRKWLPDRWVRTVDIPDSMPLLWVADAPPAHRLVLIGDRLKTVLGSRAMRPHETTMGWVLLDAPPEYDLGVRPLIFRVTIEDTAGNSASIVLGSTPPNTNVGPDRGFAIREPVDLQGYSVKHVGDKPQ